MRKLSFVLLMIVMFLPKDVYADAAYASKNEMIEKAKVIAIVNIIKIESVKVKGKHWTYGQKATAKVEQILKGKIPLEITMYGMEDFICAQCRYEAGKFLVFLKYDNNLLNCSNWHLSIRPIKGDKVEWYKKDDDMFALEYLPLSEAIKDIKSKVKVKQ